MAEITVRKIRFSFDESIELDGSDEMLASLLPMLGLSMTMPYLEPYLIRTMRSALPQISDPELAEDTRRFSQQEGHHYRNHSLFNDRIRKSFDPATAERLRALERDMEADYQRYTKGKPLRFNVAYAEGFEAMTCASALAMAEHGSFDQPQMLPGGEIWAWHMAEEIEHRTVAFNVYRHLVGSYAYRIVFGTWAQYHYGSYVARFARCMAAGLGRKLVRPNSPMHRAALRRYLRTWSPRYDPAKIDVPEGVDRLLERYSAVAKQASA
jgi:predicted metal-dependent hydrolase